MFFPQRYRCALFLAVILALFAPLGGWAQVTGATLTGVIRDAQGGAVVGAKVSATDLATGVVASTVTNRSGAYTVPNLTAGNYAVAATAPGFKTTSATLALSVGQKQEMNLGLTVGQAQQQVE